MRIGRWLLVCVITLVAQSAVALRCGHSLIQEGDYKVDVLDKCGEPDSKDFHYERRGNANHANAGIYGYNNRYHQGNSFNYGQQNYQEVEVLVEEWIYDFGRARLRKLLRFENGKLKEVESLGKSR
jgi:Protein of unknown function (DUF2845)